MWKVHYKIGIKVFSITWSVSMVRTTFHWSYHFLQASLTTILQSLAKVGSCVLQLQSFINEMRNCPASYCNSDDSTITSQQVLRCQTYEAYAEGLAEFLHSFRDHLVQLEKTVLIQGEYECFHEEMVEFFNKLVIVVRALKSNVCE